jgi:hypothetical protein
LNLSTGSKPKTIVSRKNLPRNLDKATRYRFKNQKVFKSPEKVLGKNHKIIEF